MRHTPRQAPRNRTVQILHHSEVRREEDVKVALVDHGRRDGDGAATVARLHDGAVDARGAVGEAVEVAGYEAVGGEGSGEDVEELHEARGDVLWEGEVGGER